MICVWSVIPAVPLAHLLPLIVHLAMLLTIASWWAHNASACQVMSQQKLYVSFLAVHSIPSAYNV